MSSVIGARKAGAPIETGIALMVEPAGPRRVGTGPPFNLGIMSVSDAPVPSAPSPVDAERVRACVQELGLRYFVDDEGDVGIP